MVRIYLGEPPKHIKDWMIAHYSNDIKNPLRFTSCEDGCLLKLNDPTATPYTQIPSFQYKKNGSNDWIQYNNEEIALNANDYVEFKAIGDNTSKFSRENDKYTFSFSKKVNASGNIQSLLVENDFENKKDVPRYCYKDMFNGCTNLQTAPQLPATTLATQCYNSIFYGCTSLQTAPQLPATTLANSCYSAMFYGCTSLQTAPQLPATTLADSCYSTMFYRCTSLQTAPQLPATTLADSCYSVMFTECTSLQTAPQLPATTLARSCYSSMFYGCTGLQTAPDLPATTLASYCYYEMFHGCAKFDSVNMKKSMEGVYSGSTHGYIRKTVNYVLD